MTKLAIVCSHPIQYYSPWFRYLATQRDFSVKVFYLWKREDAYDPGFESKVEWDLPLLDGYEYDFVENKSSDPGTHHWKGLDNPDLIPELVQFAPDVILVFGYHYKSLYKLLLNRRRVKSPILFRGDSHRLSAKPGLREAMKKLFLTFLFRKYSGFLYVGQANRDYFSYYGVDDEKLFFCPHSVDNDRFLHSQGEAKRKELRESLGIAENDTVVLFSGKFEDKKRPLDLLRVWERLQPKNGHLVFVGSGKQEEELRKLAKPLQSVSFLPFQNQTQMPGVYALSDLVVLPSFGQYETWGLTVNEAMCMKRPCIVSSHVGCGLDLVRAYETGFVFEAGNLKELEQVLAQALSGQYNLKKMGEEAFKLVQSYSYETATRGLVLAVQRIGAGV